MKEKPERSNFDNVSFYKVSPDCSRDEFISASKVYARKVVAQYNLDVNVTNLDWEVSMRAKKRAGAVKRRSGEPTAISLTWRYFQQKGWKKTAATIRHELIHVHLINQADDHSHGERFRRWADRLSTHVNCERFCTPKWWVICGECETNIPRYRKSKLIKHPNQYQCGNCGGDFIIKSELETEDSD
jgi:predicted SprT family Zn-dependent metalloprotease